MNSFDIKKMITPPVTDNYIKIDKFDQMKARLRAISKAVCPVDCEGVWGDFTSCDPTTGTRK